MSNIIPPLISSSPPPLDLTMESEEEDEFQPPTMNYLYSSDDFELPHDLSDIDIPDMDLNRKDFHDKRKSSLSDEFINSCFVPNKSELNAGEDAAITHEEYTVKSSADLIIESDVLKNRDIILNTDGNDKTISDKELSSSEPNYESCSENSLRENDANATNKTICDVDEIEDDFGDFADFNNANSRHNSAENCSFLTLNTEKTHYNPQDDNNTKIQANNAENVDKLQHIDDNITIAEDIIHKTSDFITQKHPLSITNIPLLQNEQQNTQLAAFKSAFAHSDDEFGDFDSCTAQPEMHEQENVVPDLLHMDRGNVAGKSAEILGIMFPVGGDEREFDFARDGGEDGDVVFGNIRNLTETNALTYQWSKSNTQQCLLRVLNVDVRNILYGPGWNPSMPIFAANLTSAPLEPQKTIVPLTTTTTPSSTSTNFTTECTGAVSEAQFDWANSGLTNPLDAGSQKDVSLKEGVAGEAPKSFDSESVNSLQFAENIVDDKSADFDNFTDFQAVKTADVVENNSISNTMFPLRETYINSNEILEIRDEVQSNTENIVNNGDIQVVSCNSLIKESEIEEKLTTKNPEDDDFTEFQASLPEITLVESKQSTNRSIEYKLAIENPIEPELLINTNSQKILETWREILQPLRVASANSTVSIAWPEPGITDDEIKKFEEYSYTKTLEIAQQKTFTNAPKQTIDDEWSDFQNAAKELPLSIASLGKIAQKQCLSSVLTKQHADIPQNNIFPTPISVQRKQSVNNLTSSRLFDDDEWSDYVSHQPSTISRPITNVNPRQEDWTIGGPQFNSWTTTSSSSLQFNGFNSFGRSVLNASVKSVGAVPGKGKGGVPILGVCGQRESVPSISALPDLDFASAASRFSIGRLHQQQKK